MQDSEQKFFEELARYGSVKREPQVELAKAGAAPSAARSPARKQEQETGLEPEGSLTIDVYQTANDLVVESAIAGVGPEDLDIEVTNDGVTIHGTRHRSQEVSEEDYYYQECYWGRFSRSVILPQEVDPEAAEVTFKNGILVIRLPKLVRRKSKKLKVKAE